MNQIHWNIAVSSDTDRALRLFLARQGVDSTGGLSRFIEEAVRAHILELTVEQVKATNACVSEADMTTVVDEALQWARKQ